MIGRIHLKRTIKRTAGCLSVASGPFTRSPKTVRACVFVYHRVADIGFVDPRFDDWNVPPATFERQVKALSEFGQIVPLMDLPEKLRSDDVPDHPWVCLTFDDGFANFYHQAVPILAKYQAAATIFVPTEVVQSSEPMTFDRWACENRQNVSEDTWKPIAWEELERCLDTGLVSIGSHSHQHLNGCRCQGEEFVEEAERSREILITRFGAPAIRSYAYPYGSTRLGQVTDAYVDAVRNAGYDLAVTTDLGLADAGSNPFALPRIEAHPMDGPSVIRAKANGSLSPYFLTDRLRKGYRA